MQVFVEKEVRYKIDGAALLASRAAVKLSRRTFAKRAGWSVSWQQKLETGDVMTVAQETAEVILLTLQEAGSTIKEEL